MINTQDIMETITMIQEENLDIRTITMGISLIDCADSDIDKSCEKIYDKIYRYAKDLVSTTESKNATISEQLDTYANLNDYVNIVTIYADYQPTNRKYRTIYLSRYIKPIRIVPKSEVAENIIKEIGNRNIVFPSNVITPDLRIELENRGVEFVETSPRGVILEGEFEGMNYSQVYGGKK